MGSSEGTSVCEGQRREVGASLHQAPCDLLLLGARSPRQEEDIQNPQGGERGGKITKREKRKIGVEEGS